MRNEGWSGIFKGLNVNLLRSVVINAAELTFYDKTKQVLVEKFGRDPANIYTHFLASISSGFFGS